MTSDSMAILTLNCGSSSVKYQVYDWENHAFLASGAIERVTMGGSVITHRVPGRQDYVVQHDCPDHKVATEFIIETLLDRKVGVIPKTSMISAVGHRVVHGGSRFTKSVLVDDHIIESFRKLEELSPLHNPANITGIEAAKAVLPGVPQAAIMDTAWHQTMPRSAT
jgi:acetate kinase